MKNMDKTFKILIVMILITLLLFGLKTYIQDNNKIDYSKQEYIELNNENIPSIYKIIGNKEIIKTDTGIDSKGNYIELIYKNLTLDELTKYLGEFKEYNYVLINSDEESAVIVASSKEAGKIITISADYSETQTKIKYSKGNGTLVK